MQLSAHRFALTIEVSDLLATAPHTMAHAAEESQEGNVVLYVVVGMYLALLIAAWVHARPACEVQMHGSSSCFP